MWARRSIPAVGAVKRAVAIPVSVKLSPYYTNPLNMVSRLAAAGADGVVLFNRLFQPDVSTDTEKHVFPMNLSAPGHCRLAQPLQIAVPVRAD